MMRTFSTYLGTVALVAGLFGCISTDPDDILTSLATSFSTDPTASTTDEETETSSGNGDGDGDMTTGDGDGDAAGDGDGDAGPTGCFNCPCGPGGECDDGLECNPDTMMCDLGGGGDGDGDPDPTTTGGDGDPYDPNLCEAPGMPIGVDGLEGGFCSYVCVSDADCPAGPVGTMPACALQTPDMMTYCALVCDPLADSCSPGATCKEVPNQPGVGLCTYP